MGNISGTYPQGNVERGLVDEVLDSCEDLINIFVKAAFIPDEEKKAKAVAAMMKDQFPYWAKKFETRLEENEKRGNKNGFFVGDSITIADLKFKSVFTYVAMVPGAMDFVKGYKRVSACLDAVGKNEKLKAFAEVFKKNMADSSANKKTEYKYAGKCVVSDL